MDQDEQNQVDENMENQEPIEPEPELPNHARGIEIYFDEMINDSISEDENSDLERNSMIRLGSDLQQYEISRSSRHEYLGNTEELSGRTLVEDNDCVTIPIFSQSSAHNFVLLPNQTLPLTTYCPVQQSMLNRVIENDRIIGIIHTRIGLSGPNNLVEYGTTAEIYEYLIDQNRNSVSVIAKGRQRFKVLSTQREITGCMTATVQILPEIRMNNPLYYVQLPSQSKYNSSNVGKGNIKCEGSSRDVIVACSKSVWKSRKRASHLTPWPSWVYDLYDDKQLAVRLVNDIMQHYDKIAQKLEIPRDAQELSHWAAICLPLSNSQRLCLLSLNTTTQRLRFLLSITSQNKSSLLCKNCGILIANTSNIFCMSTEGPQGAFVNPDGYVHQMITVTEGDNIRPLGIPITDHSWFPGYAWTFAHCSSCSHHVGWLYSAKKKLKPQFFLGLTCTSIQIDFTTDDSSQLSF